MEVTVLKDMLVIPEKHDTIEAENEIAFGLDLVLKAEPEQGSERFREAGEITGLSRPNLRTIEIIGRYPNYGYRVVDEMYGSGREICSSAFYVFDPLEEAIKKA